MIEGEIKLGGRTFLVVNYEAITSLNEMYVMKLMRETGLDRVLPEDDGLPSLEEIKLSLEAGRLSKTEHEGLLAQKKATAAEYMQRLHMHLVDSLRLHELLAGYLLPLGQTEADFTLEGAAELAQFMKGLQSRDDREEILRLGSLVVIDFFREGIASWERSMRSLQDRMETMPRPTEPAPIAAH